MKFNNFTSYLSYTRSLGIPDAYAVALYCQARLETNFFTSNLFVNYNNAFGMRIAGQRDQDKSGQIQTQNGVFATYSSQEQSLNDRIHLDSSNGVSLPRTGFDMNNYIQKVINNNYVGNPKSDEAMQYLKNWSNIIVEVFTTHYDELDIDGTPDDVEVIGTNTGNPIAVAGINPKTIIFGIVAVLIAVFGKKIVKKFLPSLD